MEELKKRTEDAEKEIEGYKKQLLAADKSS